MAIARTGSLLAVLAAAGCVKLPSSQPKAEVKSLQSKPQTQTSITPTALQSESMRFADEFSMAIAQAADDFARNVGTFDAREIAARIKLGQATAAVIDAAGLNPTVNALDLVVLASVSRIVAQEYLVDERFGNSALVLLETSRRLETNSWTLIEHVLKPEQKEELKELIREWRRKNPDARYVGAVRFREFAEAIGTTDQKLFSKPNSVFSLLFLDPMAGLDPTVRAVEETRYLAERAFYYGQRMPILISWQAEYLALRLSDQPAARQVLTNANQLTDSLEVFAKTAGQLPQVINHEREAAIQQIFAGIATERSNLLAGFAAEEGKMRSLLTDTRGALVAASDAATAVHSAVQSLDSFVRYVAPPKTNQPVNPKKKPFDVLDYGTAAGQISGMAKELNTLLVSLNQSTPQAAQLGKQARANLEQTLHQGFWLGVVLIVILLLGALLAALSYRILVAKLTRDQRRGEP
jgi:hypothetical protein